MKRTKLLYLTCFVTLACLWVGSFATVQATSDGWNFQASQTWNYTYLINGLSDPVNITVEFASASPTQLVVNANQTSNPSTNLFSGTFGCTNTTLTHPTNTGLYQLCNFLFSHPDNLTAFSDSGHQVVGAPISWVWDDDILQVTGSAEITDYLFLYVIQYNTDGRLIRLSHYQFVKASDTLILTGYIREIPPTTGNAPSTGIPGFLLFFFIPAIGLALILLRRSVHRRPEA